MKIALVSLNQAWENKYLNRQRCEEFISHASGQNCDIVIFPEMTLTGFTMQTQLGEPIENSETIQFFSVLAEKYHVHLVFGLILLNDPLPLNSAIALSPDGMIVSRYDKIHPFSFSGEDKFFSAGNSLSYFRIGDEQFGITICFDLRFPELYQALSKDSKIILNIANWPASRIEHWKILLRARAIENQVFMIGVNRTGVDGKKLEYPKSSKIFDPDGNELKPVSGKDEIDIFEIDLSSVRQYRGRFPFKLDRKPGLYKTLL